MAGDHCGRCDALPGGTPAPGRHGRAQRILDAVIGTGERFGMEHVSAVLLGRTTRRIRDLEHDRLGVFASVTDHDEAALRAIGDALVDRGLLTRGDGHRSILAVTGPGRGWLRSGRRLEIDLPDGAPAPGRERTGDPRRAAPGGPARADYDRALFGKLRAVRRELADAQGKSVPAVFTDRVLRSLARERPTSPEQMRRVVGIGRPTFERSGEPFPRGDQSARGIVGVRGAFRTARAPPRVGGVPRRDQGASVSGPYGGRRVSERTDLGGPGVIGLVDPDRGELLGEHPGEVRHADGLEPDPETESVQFVVDGPGLLPIPCTPRRVDLPPLAGLGGRPGGSGARAGRSAPAAARATSTSTLGGPRRAARVDERDDRVEDRHRGVVFVHEREFGLGPGPDEPDLVLVRTEAGPGQGDVVGDDEVDALALELGFGRSPADRRSRRRRRTRTMSAGAPAMMSGRGLEIDRRGRAPPRA